MSDYAKAAGLVVVAIVGLGLAIALVGLLLAYAPGVLVVGAILFILACLFTFALILVRDMR